MGPAALPASCRRAAGCPGTSALARCSQRPGPPGAAGYLRRTVSAGVPMAPVPAAAGGPVCRRAVPDAGRPDGRPAAGGIPAL